MVRGGAAVNELATAEADMLRKENSQMKLHMQELTHTVAKVLVF